MKYKIINSDVYAGIYSLQDNSIDVAITSPPYWGQRDYGFKGQIGNESSYKEYIAKLVAIFSLLRNKIKSDGVFFLNIGDKYLSKYGKSPLGMIPYKLAYLMVKDGWKLNDIIIWYKPNHMPSSIKNRFANSYEPVFVLSKFKDNIFSIKKNNDKNYTNILKINLQPTIYKHVAVYPEKLVEELLGKVNLTNNATILDPFAGSGTTLKVVKDLNKELNAIMIENNKKYIDIIKKRCNLNSETEFCTYNFIQYYYENRSEDNQLYLFEKQAEYSNKADLNLFTKNGFIKIFDEPKDYYSLLQLFKNKSIKNHINLHSTCFIGCKNFDIDLIYQTSQLNDMGWVIRNVIVVEEDKKWYPIFMIVDDNKKTDYIFNYKNLNLKSKTKYQRDWNLTNFLGYRVLNSINKERAEGKIVDIVEKLNNGFPKYVIVKWSDGRYTKEFVINSQEEINKNIIIDTANKILKIREIENLTDLNKSIKFKVKETPTNKKIEQQINYSGKFKDEKRINWGASPGARASIEQEYFSLQRLYEVEQNLVADYINFKRIQKGLTKQGLTDLFPKDYKYTVGHWLRKDFGGSIPTPEDWQKLDEILGFEEEITNYVCKSALKLQTVKNGEFKLPEDFINSKSLNILQKLIEK